MKFFFLILMILFFSAPVLAQDIVQTQTATFYGKISVSSDGLIKMNTNGIEQSFVRSKNIDYYSDFIKYKPNPFSKQTVETSCRLLFVDFYHATFEVQSGHRNTIPRYRIKQIILNTI